MGRKALSQRKMCIRDRATAIYSANNAAYAIAEYVSNGDIDSFIKKMNKKAKDIGADVYKRQPNS